MPPPTKYSVALSGDERARLRRASAATSRWVRSRALVLLYADEGLPNSEIARKVGTSEDTVWRTRKRYREEGIESVLRLQRPRKPGSQEPGRKPGLRWGKNSNSFSTETRRRLVELSHSAPPEGKARWTFGALAEEAQRLGIVERISGESVRKILKARAER